MEIGNKIMELRKKNGLSQEELAEKIGVARQTISKWELGETSPELNQAKELSKVYIDRFFGKGLFRKLIPKPAKVEFQYDKENLNINRCPWVTLYSY